ncbi:MAG: response regulator transcription factor [Bacillota bacterium]|nr:response regulator transcription factor [Bacillota bacterium]
MPLVNNEQVNILVVDDEESIVEFIKMGLEGEGFTVYTAFDGNEAVNAAKAVNPHIVILDIMLPGISGFEVCSEIKKAIKTSIIMLTARDEVDDRVKGLDLGADDYMVKPFSFKELIARINARLRNNFPELTTDNSTGGFNIDDGAHEIYYLGKLLDLTPTEYNLLKYLLANVGLVLSKTTILEKVWGFDFNGEANIVEVYIRYLRDKIGDKEHNIIRTVRGVGYKVIVQ